MQYPPHLHPVGDEELRLASGTMIRVPKVSTTFKRWRGTPLENTYGNKPVIDAQGEPVFAELAILRLFQAQGWQGVWINTYRNKTRIAIDRSADLSPDKAALLRSIQQAGSGRSGCFDVLCWRDDCTLFAEAKWRGHDRIRPQQSRWLTAALSYGLPLEVFLIVEWAFEESKG